MNNPIEPVLEFAKEKPLIAVGAGIAGAAVIFFVMKPKATGESDTDTYADDPNAPSQFAGYMPPTNPPVIGNYTGPASPISQANGGRPGQVPEPFWTMCKTREVRASGTRVCIPASGPYRRIEQAVSGTVRTYPKK